MKTLLLKITVGSVMLLASQCAVATEKGEHQYALLTGQHGLGMCNVKQIQQQVKMSIRVTNLTPESIASAWLKYDGVTVGRFDGTLSDASGNAIFSGDFELNRYVEEFTVDVRNHNRDIRGVVDNDDLQTEINQPTNSQTGESIKMGTCTFANLGFQPED